MKSFKRLFLTLTVSHITLLIEKRRILHGLCHFNEQSGHLVEQLSLTGLGYSYPQSQSVTN